jgi:hypothetical protein
MSRLDPKAYGVGLGVDGTRLIPPTWVALTGITLCGLIPLATLAGTPTPTGGALAWMLAIAVLVLAGARLAWLIGLGAARLTSISFWIFTYVFMGLAPLIQMRTGRYPSTTPGIETQLNAPAMWVVLAGALAVLAGERLMRPSPATRAARDHAAVHETRVVLLAVAALALNGYFVYKVGAGALLSSRSELRAVEYALWPNGTLAVMIVAVCTMPLLVAFLALLRVNRQRRARGLMPLRFLTFATCTAVLFSVNPISSPRYYFGTVILAVLAGLGAYSTPNRVRWMSVAFLVGLVAVFPLADAFRLSTTGDFSGENPLASMTSGDFDAFAQVNNTLYYVGHMGITWGMQALGVLLFWVPRSVWPSKPLDTGTLIAQTRDYGFTNVSSPIWSELFINGGWLVLPVGMLALGMWMRWFDAGPGRRVLAMILPFYMMILLRGSLLQAMAYLSVLVLASWFVSSRGSAAVPRRSRPTYTRPVSPGAPRQRPQPVRS